MHEQPNPALQSLEVLSGSWEMELSNAAFLPSPSATVKGAVSFEWIQSRAFLVMSMGDKLSGAPNAIWLFSRDETNPHYTVLYYDARSVSRVYEMSFSGSVWKMWREAPGFRQRYEGTLSKNSKTITAHWEKSSDGINWEHDFDVTYTKLD